MNNTDKTSSIRWAIVFSLVLIVLLHKCLLKSLPTVTFCMQNQIEKLKFKYNSLETGTKKKLIVSTSSTIAILFIILIWNLAFDWSTSTNIPFKTGSYQISHLGKSININVTKIDYQVFKKVNGKIVYPRNGLYATMHYVIKNNTEEEITYSTGAPFISTAGKKYLPISPINRETVQPSSTASDIITFDLPYEVNGLFISATEYYHNFVFAKSFMISI